MSELRKSETNSCKKGEMCYNCIKFQWQFMYKQYRKPWTNHESKESKKSMRNLCNLPKKRKKEEDSVHIKLQPLKNCKSSLFFVGSLISMLVILPTFFIRIRWSLKFFELSDVCRLAFYRILTAHQINSERDNQ